MQGLRLQHVYSIRRAGCASVAEDGERMKVPGFDLSVRSETRVMKDELLDGLCAIVVASVHCMPVCAKVMHEMDPTTAAILDRLLAVSL